MAAGLPVIASDLPAHRNVIKDQETGIIVADKTQLANAITRLSDLQTNMAMGRAAKMWVKEAVGTWSDCADRYIRLYRQLL